MMVTNPPREFDPDGGPSVEKRAILYLDAWVLAQVFLRPVFNLCCYLYGCNGRKLFNFGIYEQSFFSPNSLVCVLFVKIPKFGIIRESTNFGRIVTCIMCESTGPIFYPVLESTSNSEPHPGFHPAVTAARHLVWRQYGFRGNAITKSNQPNAGPIKTI
ncbi:hypothetical protein Hanom_Chr11g01000681 [Helianthus anomalus]